jgi:plasmid maintenance system killer protein
MGDLNMKDRIKKMANAIKQEAQERVKTIEDNTQEQFVIARNDIINKEKDKMSENFTIRVNQYVTHKKM